MANNTWPFPWPEDQIAHYTAYRVNDPPLIDGRLDEPDWRAAPKSTRFRDLVNGDEVIHDTRTAILWDDDNLYVGFWVEEPAVAATLTERDDPIYKNNDVEVFIAGLDTYYEFEINAFGTIYEVFFIWEEAYERHGFDKVPEFNRYKQGVRCFPGVGFQPHPRGPRIGYWNWDFPGLQSAVYVDGEINNEKIRDRGWVVELALPWTGMAWLAKSDGRALPPEDGDIWRMDFSRFNQYKEATPSRDTSAWAWSPHGVMDSHIPEVWPYIHFSTQNVCNL